MVRIIFYSGPTENVLRFVDKLGAVASRLPTTRNHPLPKPEEPFVLITSTYGGGTRRGADVPPSVIRFLNIEENRNRLIGVIGSGSVFYGDDYAKAAEIVATKCNVPLLYKFDLAGTDEDVANVRKIIDMEIND